MSNRIIMRAGYSPVTKWHSVQVQRQCVMPGACHFIITSHWILPSSVSLSVCSSDSSAVPEGERSPQATWNVPSCALTQQIEKAGDFWQEQLNLHSPPAPHTRFSLFIFILFIFHFNTKQQLFMFYEGSINMQKKNLKLINRIIISCLSQNELLSYIYPCISQDGRCQLLTEQQQHTEGPVTKEGALFRPLHPVSPWLAARELKSTRWRLPWQQAWEEQGFTGPLPICALLHTVSRTSISTVDIPPSLESDSNLNLLLTGHIVDFQHIFFHF